MSEVDLWSQPSHTRTDMHTHAHTRGRIWSGDMPLNKGVKETLRLCVHRLGTVTADSFGPQVQKSEKLLGKLPHRVSGCQKHTLPSMPLPHVVTVLYCSNLVHVLGDLGDEYMKKKTCWINNSTGTTDLIIAIQLPVWSAVLGPYGRLVHSSPGKTWLQCFAEDSTEFSWNWQWPFGRQ